MEKKKCIQIRQVLHFVNIKQSKIKLKKKTIIERIVQEITKMQMHKQYEEFDWPGELHESTRVKTS